MDSLIAHSPLIISQENAKEIRAERIDSIAGREQFVIDLAADLMNVDEEVIVEGIADSDDNIEKLSELFKENGQKAVMIAHQLMPPPGIGKH